LTALAKIRSREGYMASVAQNMQYSFPLVENHCPICAAAAACQGLRRSELAIFRAVLGDDVTVELTDQIFAGVPPLRLPDRQAQHSRRHSTSK
jgi:predicted ArsR family transcriptional regulator